MNSAYLSQFTASDFPNALAGPEPIRSALRLRPGMLGLLLILCLLTRALMCIQIEGIYADAALYIHSAKSLEQGDLFSGLQAMNLNVFPVVLMLLHRVGLDWETAGSWWGVFISSLVVLPMFGWVRRQFDDQVALVACLLYAFHPKMIQWSPEIVRDPTFWFFFMMSIYLLWRAVSEVRVIFFLAAGVTVFLAVLTRFEGLLLFIPLLLWSFWRWLALTSNRSRLILGIILCLSAMPLLVVLVNIVFLHKHPRWETFRISPLELVQGWTSAMLRSSNNAPNAAGASLTQLMHVFFPSMTRGLSPLYALLMFGGLWGWRHIWSRRDHQALFYAALANLAGIWIHAWHAHTTSTRYAFPIVLMAIPFAALGFFGFVGQCRRVLSRLFQGKQFNAAPIWGSLAIIVAFGTAASLLQDYSYRKSEISLGHWIRDCYGEQATIVGPVCFIKEVNYYAAAKCLEFSKDCTTEALLALVAREKPDVVLLSFSREKYPLQNSLIQSFAELGLARVPEADLPPASREMLVFACDKSVKNPPASSVKTALRMERAMSAD